MINTKDDLVGKYIDCSNKNDLEAFIGLVRKFDLSTRVHRAGTQTEKFIRSCRYVIYSGGQDGYLTHVAGMDECCGYTQIFASDMNTIDYEPYYEPVHYDSIFDTMKDFREGLLFCKQVSGSYKKITTERELTENHELITLYKLARFIPLYDENTENKAMNAVDAFLDSCSSFDAEPGPITIAHDEWKYQYRVEHSDFLEACRVALRAVGEM